MDLIAADGGFFRIVCEGEPYYGVSTEPPLDYQGDEYYVLRANDIPSGYCTVHDGSDIKARFSSDEVFTVTKYLTKATIAGNVIMILFLVTLMWFIGALIIAGLGGAF